MPELTMNAFIAVVAIPILGWYLRRLINRNDRLSEERHQNILAMFGENRVDHLKFFLKLDSHESRISFLEGERILGKLRDKEY